MAELKAAQGPAGGQAEAIILALKARARVLGAPRSAKVDSKDDVRAERQSELAFPKEKRLRNKDHLKFVARQPCLICGRKPTHAHHVRFAQARALGLKVSDEFTVPLCSVHHDAIHLAGNEQAWWLAQAIDPLKAAAELWARSAGERIMSDEEALRVALDLLHVPSRVRIARSELLPKGVPILLRIAAGDQEAASRAALLMGREPQAVQDAATFFIEQILMCPEADSYRVLGANQDASNGELRQNMALLIKWLHPDGQLNQQARFISRVTLAWDDLKTPERRAAYDNRALKGARRPRRSAKARQRSRMPVPRLYTPQPARRGLLQRALYFLLGRRSR